MKHLLISVFVAVALFATAATAFRSHSPLKDASNTITDMSSMKKSPDAAGKPTLPDEEIDDMSVEFSTPTKHSK
jgi:hypothetical protein